MNNTAERLKEYAQAVEVALAGYLPARGRLQDTVVDAMAYSLLGGGKRLRAALTLEFYRLYAGDYRPALPLACSVEMIHAYSLIHDDLPCMDDDDMRRGKPSCHIQFGEAIALLAGDGLLTLAFEMLPKASEIPPDRLLAVCATLAGAAGADGMLGGQVIDLSFEGKPVTEEVLSVMHKLKTSAMIRAAARMGLQAAGCGERELALADRYAERLGLAFQITDDILDCVGDEKLLGKPVHSDSENQKTTYATLYGVQKAGEIAAQLVQEAKSAAQELEVDSAFLCGVAELMLHRQS